MQHLWSFTMAIQSFPSEIAHRPGFSTRQLFRSFAQFRRRKAWERPGRAIGALFETIRTQIIICSLAKFTNSGTLHYCLNIYNFIYNFMKLTFVKREILLCSRVGRRGDERACSGVPFRKHVPKRTHTRHLLRTSKLLCNIITHLYLFNHLYYQFRKHNR